MTARRSVARRASVAVAVALLVAGLGLVGAGAASAADVVPADPAFGGTFYLADANTLKDLPAGSSVGWDQPVTALPAPGDQKNRLTAPAGAQSVVTFVAPQGHETDMSSWNATAPWDLTPPGQWLADVTPYHLITPGVGSPSGTNALAHVSGDYSLGVAYLKDGGATIVPGGLYFVHIHLTGAATPEDAGYTWQPIRATGTAPAGHGASTGAGSTDAGLLSFVSSAASGDPLGTLTVGGPAASGTAAGSGSVATPGWTLTVSTGADTRTLATGSGAARTPVDTAGVTAGPSAGTTITLTLVSG